MRTIKKRERRRILGPKPAFACGCMKRACVAVSLASVEVRQTDRTVCACSIADEQDEKNEIVGAGFGARDVPLLEKVFRAQL
jgi:hypothetical protein